MLGSDKSNPGSVCDPLSKMQERSATLTYQDFVEHAAEEKCSTRCQRSRTGLTLQAYEAILDRSR